MSKHSTSMAEKALDIERDTPPQEGSRKKPLVVEVEKVVVLSFRALQLQRIAELQDELLNLAVISARNEDLPSNHKDTVDSALKCYAEALRNYETLSLNALASIPPGSRLVGVLGNVGDNLPEPSRSYTTELIQKGLGPLGSCFIVVLNAFNSVLYELFPSFFMYSGITMSAVGLLLSLKIDNTTGLSPSRSVEVAERAAGNLGFRELDQKGRIQRERKKAFTGRVIMAMFGGAALIGPMLVMTLHQSRNTSLITVSVATFIFALALAVGAGDSSGKDVLAATAAYAAVLVVFVGTSSGSGS